MVLDTQSLAKVFQPRRLEVRYLRLTLAVATAATLTACATTTTATLIPAPQAPVCQPTTTAQVLWATQWRPDQKDVPERDAAAAEGLARFFQGSGCFQSAAVQRLPQADAATLAAAVAAAAPRYGKVVVVVVRELGPTVKIGASLALVEGGTEVVLDLAEHLPQAPAPRRFSVQWRSGGPGVVKGVATLPQDMQAALAAGLQPPQR